MNTLGHLGTQKLSRSDATDAYPKAFTASSMHENLQRVCGVMERRVLLYLARSFSKREHARFGKAWL